MFGSRNRRTKSRKERNNAPPLANSWLRHWPRSMLVAQCHSQRKATVPSSRSVTGCRDSQPSTDASRRHGLTWPAVRDYVRSTDLLQKLSHSDVTHASDVSHVTRRASLHYGSYIQLSGAPVCWFLYVETFDSLERVGKFGKWENVQELTDKLSNHPFSARRSVSPVSQAKTHFCLLLYDFRNWITIM